jgi:hypothetical protein
VTISSVSLTNFKGFGEKASVDFRPITLLFGANSAGKSSVLQALLYAREIMERRNMDPDRTKLGGAAVDLGGFRNIVHNHNSDLPIVLRFDLDLRKVDLIDYCKPEDVKTEELEQMEELSGGIASAWIQIQIKWGKIAAEPVQADYEVAIDGAPIARILTESGTGSNHRVQFNDHHPWIYLESLESGAYTNLSGSEHVADWRDTSVSEIDNRAGTSRDFETLLDEIRYVLAAHDLGVDGAVLKFALLSVGEYLLHQLKQLRYLGPIRAVPDRSYTPTTTPDASRWSDGIAAWDWIHSCSEEQLSDLNKWLLRPDRLNAGYRVDVKRFKELDAQSMAMIALSEESDFLDNYDMIRREIEALPTKTRILLRQERDFLDVMPQDVGIGVSQVIPVIVAALIPREGLTVMEQPELHIHPAIQVALGDLFIQQTHADIGLEKQFIIETHSEHLLLRLLRRVRETTEGSAPTALDLSPENLAIYYVEATTEGTRIKRLNVSEGGRFTDRWPHGFFEEREKEFFGEPGDVASELERLFGQ